MRTESIFASHMKTSKHGIELAQRKARFAATSATWAKCRNEKYMKGGNTKRQN